jgi:hypothetical protein
MLHDFILIIVGVIAIVWARWYLPREMSRIQVRLEQRGRSTQRFDVMLRSRAYRMVVIIATVAGTVGVIFGVIMVLVGE